MQSTGLWRLILLMNLFLLTVARTSQAASAGAGDGAALVEPYNVVWDTPSIDSTGSMPLGNGDIGLNVWVEKSGDLVFYISKTDAWGDDVPGPYGMPKVGRVRIKLSPNPFAAARAADFRQTLMVGEGQIMIAGGASPSPNIQTVWVDANNPVIHVQIATADPADLEVAVEPYRKVPTADLNADLLFSGRKDSVAWCYRNRSKDGPNANLTFGAVIEGSNLKSTSDTTLHSAAPHYSYDVAIYPNTAHAPTSSAWLEQLERQIASLRRIDTQAAHRHHSDWWRQFWNRSWIIAEGDAAAAKITQGYVLQRFVTACAGRGAYPIKFNGSIFTTDNVIPNNDSPQKGARATKKVTADYRTWGGNYWFQNTRAMYWPMLASGDLDVMQPLFRMYLDMLPVQRKAVRDYYGHGGVYFDETVPFWGGMNPMTPQTPGHYIHHYYTPVLELSAMMLDYFAYSGDEQFARQTAIPLADDGLRFFDEHFPRDDKGKLLIKPANALETYWKVCNPAPNIAGLRWVIGRLLDLPHDLADDSIRSRWSRLLGEVPELPVGTRDGNAVLLPFESADDPKSYNSENPELYAIYPFRLYGLGKPELALARDTFAVRVNKQTTCWYQDPIQAAYLGDAELAKADVLKNFTARASDLRFPGFWASGNDYMPDEDNGGNAQNALQLMLFQCEGHRMLLLPAWPKNWSANFKLHAPHRTTVQGTVRDGKITALKVTPAERQRDVEIMQPDGTFKPFAR